MEVKMTCGIMRNQEIESLEQNIEKLQKELVELRNNQPAKTVDNYNFKDKSSNDAKLSELFGDNDHLILIHNMGSSCSYCTMWADGINGIYKHLQKKAAFAFVSPDSPSHQADFAEKNGWTFEMHSSEDNSFNADVGFENAEGGAMPGVSTFRKNSDGTIELLAQSYFGPGDPYCSIWHFFDLLPIKIEH